MISALEWGPAFQRSLDKSEPHNDNDTSSCHLTGAVVFYYQTPVICVAALWLKVFHKPGSRFEPPSGSRWRFGNEACGAGRQRLCTTSRSLVYQLQSSTLKNKNPRFLSCRLMRKLFQAYPAMGSLPLISSICLFGDSYNHFFFCQHYFKHKDFLCRCLSLQNNDGLQSDPQ